MNKWCAVVGRLAESRTPAAQGINTNRTRENTDYLIDLSKRVSSISTVNRQFYTTGGRQRITSRRILDSDNRDLPKSPCLRHLFLVS